MFTQLLTWGKSALGPATKEELSPMTLRASASENSTSLPFSEEWFTRFLCLERKRAERSRKPFTLMLIDARKILHMDRHGIVLGRLAAALSASIRETDICGWYENASVIGIILTEIGSADTHVVHTTMLSRVNSAFRVHLGTVRLEDIHISFHVFPEDLGSQNGGPADTGLHLYPDLYRQDNSKKARCIIKRVIDIAGSLTALILLSPVLLAIAFAIKLTSKGPILFKQMRIGRYGVPFTFLKFRSMYYLNDAKIHEEYVRRFITGKDDCRQSDGNGDVYKLTGDPRVTPLGKFLRRTSLDELPQLFNVLRGQMSLVGPRPPVSYETEVYDIWHRRRFLEVKPGITGLWQVRGRSKCKFDEMVRLDLKYARDWSLTLDLKILLETPRAVFFADGAY